MGKLRNDEVDDEKKYRIIDAYFNEVIAYRLSKDYRNKK